MRKHFSEEQRGKVHAKGEKKHVNYSRNNTSEVCAEENNNLVSDFLLYTQIILVFLPNEYYIFIYNEYFQGRKIESTGFHLHLYRNIYFVRHKTQDHSTQWSFI